MYALNKLNALLSFTLGIIGLQIFIALVNLVPINQLFLSYQIKAGFEK